MKKNLFLMVTLFVLGANLQARHGSFGSGFATGALTGVVLTKATEGNRSGDCYCPDISSFKDTIREQKSQIKEHQKEIKDLNKQIRKLEKELRKYKKSDDDDND